MKDPRHIKQRIEQHIEQLQCIELKAASSDMSAGRMFGYERVFWVSLGSWQLRYREVDDNALVDRGCVAIQVYYIARDDALDYSSAHNNCIRRIA